MQTITNQRPGTHDDLPGVPRVETVGAIVRGPYGHLGRVAEVLERTRASANHVVAPSDVVVRLETVGRGYNHTSSWASKLIYADRADVGSHPCHNGPGWKDVPASWQGGDRGRDACESCRASD